MKTYKALLSILVFSFVLISCKAQVTKDCEKRISELNGENSILKNRIDSLQKQIPVDEGSQEEVSFSYDILNSVVNFHDKKYTIFIVDPLKYEMELFNYNEKKKSFYDFNTVRSELKEKDKAMLMVMNAGMYKPARIPQGLYINKGVEYAPVDTVKNNGKGNFFDLPPNGIFILDVDDKAQVITTDKFRTLDSTVVSTFYLATQSGPMLLIDNEMNTAFMKGSSNLNIRNGVGVNGNGEVVFIISNERVNFYEFAELFQNLGCSNALYLDGAISKMAVPGLHVSSNPSFEYKLPNSSHLGPIIAVFK